MSAGRIVVVGAANMDLISYVDRLPSRGETLHGSSFQTGHGGKGANQAVMAARLGSHVTMVAKVGRDVFGDSMLENFRANDVGITHVHVTEEAFSGVAPIAVEPGGTNAIIIVTGANDLLTVNEIERARAAINAADALVCQLEIPLELSLTALRIAREEGTRTILNPAPARSLAPTELYELADIICPNEPETELLTGGSVATLVEAEAQARKLRELGAHSVVLTLGERGCLVVDDEGVSTLSAVPVDPVDTTGAGDAFVGCLAHFLGAGFDLRTAALRANHVAGMSVTGRGTQSSFPRRRDLPAHLLEDQTEGN